ncbi:hypothetical protein ACSTG0_23540, partial [Vibrio parahaemolyticus]
NRVSAGGTAGVWDIQQTSILTGYRAGTYVYGDRTCVANGSVAPSACALEVYATVISRPTSSRAILDAGTKALSSDPVEAP